MKALIYYGPEDIRVTETTRPEPGQGEVLIKVKAVGICGSDVHGYLGKTGRRIPPMIMGHEFSGIVEKTGGRTDSFKPGDRVVILPTIYCGVCEQCRKGLTNVCEKRGLLGVMDVNGAMAEYVLVEEKQVLSLPDNLSFIEGAVVEPVGVAYRAVSRAGSIEGKVVLVVGAGPIGLFVVEVLKSRNPARIIVTDLSDYRLSLAEKLGADVTVNPSKANMEKAIADLTNGKGVDIAIEAVGATPTVQQALGALKNSGTCVWIGNSAKMIQINMQNIVTRELRVFGTYIYTLDDFIKAIQLMSDGKINIGPIVSRRISLEEAPEMFKLLGKAPEEPVKVIIEM